MRKMMTAVVSLLGYVFCLGGALMMLLGVMRTNASLQISGVILYAASLPLLFQIKFSQMDGRIQRLENKIK